jgi:endonuclease G
LSLTRGTTVISRGRGEVLVTQAERFADAHPAVVQGRTGTHGLWGRLEDAVFADVEVDDLRVSVYGGPVFGADDRVFRGVPIPREFWKVIAFVEAGTLKASAFLLTQNLDQLEALELDEFRVFQVSLADLEERTKVRFADPIRAADTLGVRVGAVGPQPPLESLSDIVWG